MRHNAAMRQTIYMFNGPNLNLLGTREPDIYGAATLADAEALARRHADAAGYDLDARQTNAEHELVAWIQSVRTGAAGIIINPAAFSYAAYSVLDALKMVDAPIIEVHISNIHARAERWRARSLLANVATAVITGCGIHGYALAVDHIAHLRQSA